MGQINFDFNFWTLTILLLNLVMTLITTISNRSKVADNELKEVKKSLHDDITKVYGTVVKHGHRLSRLEVEVENGITKEDLVGVHRRMDFIVEKTGAIGEMSKRLENLDKHLMLFISKQVGS